jgi:hypothetical protein
MKGLLRLIKRAINLQDEAKRILAGGTKQQSLRR